MSWASSWTGGDDKDDEFDITKSYKNGVQTTPTSPKTPTMTSTSSLSSGSSGGSGSPLKIGEKKQSPTVLPSNHITKSISLSQTHISTISNDPNLLPIAPLTVTPKTPDTKTTPTSTPRTNTESFNKNGSVSSVSSFNSSSNGSFGSSSGKSTPRERIDTPNRDRYQMIQLQQHQNQQYGHMGSDWSFMMAMDSESGKELHRSMTSMTLKYEGPNGANTSNGNLNTLKSSNGMGPPPSSPSTSTGSSTPPTYKSELSNGSLKSYSGSPTLKVTNVPSSTGSPTLVPSALKFSGGMGPPPPSNYQVTPTSITNAPILGKKDKVNKSTGSMETKHLKKMSTVSGTLAATTGNLTVYQTASTTTASVSVVIKQKENSNDNSANNSTSSSPVSGSPITPSTTPPNKSIPVDLLGFLRKRKTSNSESPKGSPRNKDLDKHQQLDDNLSDTASALSPLAEDEEEDINYLNVSFANTDKIYEGWMEMLVSRHWKKLWFVIRIPNLEYYKGWWEDKGTVTQSEDNGKILLNYWYTFSPITFEDGKAIFSLIQSSDVEKANKKLKIKFRCDDESIAKRWISEMEEVIKRRKETTVTLRPLQSNESKTRDRRPTISGPNVYLQSQNADPNGLLASQKLQFPQEMLDELEPDEKVVLEDVKLLLDEFPAKPLPEGETISSYRSKRRSTDGYYRVLSMDGGGLRSVMTCILIERIVKRFPQFLEYVDIFTGTSAGSIVAAGLASEIPPKATRRVLELTALPVFGKKRFNPVNNAKFNARVLKAGCYVFFQDKKFFELPRKLAVPCFQLDSEYPPEAKDLAPPLRRWTPRVFHNVGKCEDYLTNDVVGDCLLRSAAAPTYFPSYQGYIDGGLFANNPGLSAITLAMSPSLDKIPSDKIICISIGTGLASHYMEGGQDYDWGLLNWAPKLGNLLIGAQVDYLTQLCDNILGERHHRLNPPLGDSTSMDDPKLVTELATIANGIDLDETFKWIENHFLPKSS